MSNLTERIAALPEYPKDGTIMNVGNVNGLLDALEARLALARDLVQVGDVRLVRHAYDCSAMYLHSYLHSPEYPECNCGRNALLEALEVRP